MITFIDLFAGIGGIRIAFEKAGAICVFSSEYDRFAQITYESYFGEKPDFKSIKDVDPSGDITQIDPKDIPDHDILTGGFPCQPFSLAGVSKKNSLKRPHGFDDPTQGTLFFNIKEILRVKRPKAFLLENVKNLVRHDKGKTFEIISKELDNLGYKWKYRIIDAAGWIPQHRERTYIVGFRNPMNEDGDSITDFSLFDSIQPPKKRLYTLADVLEDKVPEKYTLMENTWNTLIRHKAYHAAAGNGFGYSVITPPFEEQTTRTISARYHKDGAEILIYQGKNKRPRRLTPLECSRLMGFPEDFQKLFSRDPNVQQPVSDTQAYRQFGNSVAVPLVSEIAEGIVKVLKQ